MVNKLKNYHSKQKGRQADTMSIVLSALLVSALQMY